jgi:predicted nucleic acid-binding protein
MLDGYMVDTSVAVRWFIPQVGYEHALEVQQAFIAGEVRLEAVDSIRAELGHVLRNKGLILGKITRDEYLAAVRSVDDFGVKVHPTDVDAVERAAALAADYSLRFFDAQIVDRAVVEGLTLLTSDKHLCNAVAGFAKTELLRGV